MTSVAKSHPAGQGRGLDRWWKQGAGLGVLLIGLLLFLAVDRDAGSNGLSLFFLAWLLLAFTIHGCLSTGALLWKRRWGPALVQPVVGTVVVALILNLSAITRWSDVKHFHRELPGYEARIAEQRARQPAGTPVQLVLETRDLSLFVTSTLFESVVFDDSDATLQDPCWVLQDVHCPVVPDTPSQPNAGLHAQADRIEGHYFKVIEY